MYCCGYDIFIENKKNKLYRLISNKYNIKELNKKMMEKKIHSPVNNALKGELGLQQFFKFLLTHKRARTHEATIYASPTISLNTLTCLFMLRLQSSLMSK
jgi:hypothetical protein